jgi:hypothetical protein
MLILPESHWSLLTTDPGAVAYSPMYASALVYARAGFNVVPLMPNSKELDASTGFRHGRESRYPTCEDVVGIWGDDPDRNVGVAPHPTNLLIDVDPRHGGTLETVETMGLPLHNVHRDRTQSGGWRLWYQLPPGFLAEKTAIGVRQGIDFIGPTGFAVVPHSTVNGNWYRVDKESPWTWGVVPEKWEYLDRLLRPRCATEIDGITDDDWNDARKLLRRMRGVSIYKDHIAQLYSPNWQEALPPNGDTSESGRDFFLVFAASHFLRDDLRASEILFALLWSSGWPSDPLRNHPKSDPARYAAQTVSNAIAARNARDTERLHDLAERFFPSWFPNLSPDLSPGSAPGPAFSLRPPVLVGTSQGLDEVILGLLASNQPDEFTRRNGWRRVPVNDLAAIAGVNRKTITRTLERLKSRGFIERSVIASKHDGQFRRDSLARLVSQ